MRERTATVWPASAASYHPSARKLPERLSVDHSNTQFSTAPFRPSLTAASMSTTHRLYFVLPDVASARQLADGLSLARVEDRRMHFLAKRGTELGALHEASHFQKTDVVHGATVGLVVGLFLMYFPPGGAPLQLVTLLMTTIVGALLGAWVSSMVAMQIPNSRLTMLEKAIAQGKILLILDLPNSRGSEIRAMLDRHRPEAISGGQEALVPAFP